jgi:DNA-binding CsgD family transcriptional regulator
MRVSFDADPELAWRALDRLDLALLVCERRPARVVLANERGARLLRELGGSLEQLPSLLTSLVARGDTELEAAGMRFSSTSLDDDELVLVTATMGTAAAPLSGYRLSPREREIALLAGRGLSNGEIADAAGITVGTVKQYLNRIFVAMGLKRRSQLIVRLHEALVP